MRGRIAHVFQDEEEGEGRLGLAFEELSPDQRRTLESLASRVVEGVSPASLSRLGSGAPLKEILAALDGTRIAAHYDALGHPLAVTCGMQPRLLVLAVQ